MNFPQRGLRCEILRSEHASANGGISDIYTDVVLVGAGIPRWHPVRKDTPAVILSFDGTHIRPLANVPFGRLGYMHSGAYVLCTGASEEWRKIFGHRLPFPLHDYSESVAHYEFASR